MITVFGCLTSVPVELVALTALAATGSGFGATSAFSEFLSIR